MAASVLITYGNPSTRASSDAALFVAQQASEGRRRLQSSHFLGMGGKGVFDELCTVADECRAANWDGYGASPVLDETYQHAYRLLEALPLGTPAPTIGAEADGHLTLEWYRTPSRVVSVSISPEGTVFYAALLGGSKRSGTEPFAGQMPEEILKIIHRLVPA